MTTRSETLFARAQLSIPGAVTSPVRAFKSFGGTPRFISGAIPKYDLAKATVHGAHMEAAVEGVVAEDHIEAAARG